MAYGLIVRNAAGDIILDTSSTILNYETTSVTSTTVPANGSSTVTIEGANEPNTVLMELAGTGAEDITTSATGTDTFTLTNTSSISRTVDIEYWRLK
jgi:Ca2+-binding RTX toxin-like protein